MFIHKVALPLLLIIPFNNYDYRTTFENADNSSDRCVTNHCTCRVAISPSAHQISFENRSSVSESVYFEENSSSLTQRYKMDIDRFLRDNPEETRFTIVGYADGCGSYSYNKTLSLQRASAVSQYIRRSRSGARTTIVGMSEMTDTHSDAAKRVDILSDSTMRTNGPAPNLTADFYLIDYSGSMSGKVERIERAIAANRRSTSRVYISYDRYCNNGQNINQIRPAGATEIWYSYWWILDRMRDGQTLIIFSDFDSTIPLTRRESQMIEDKVRSKNIKVYAFSP